MLCWCVLMESLNFYNKYEKLESIRRSRIMNKMPNKSRKCNNNIISIEEEIHLSITFKS